MTPSVDLEQLQQLTKEAVHEADKNGLILKITMRQLRKQVEKKLGLDDGTLDASKYKKLILSTAKAAMPEQEIDGEESNEVTKQIVETEHTPEVDEEPKKITKRKSESEATQAKKKSRVAPSDKPKSQKKTKDESSAKKGKSVEKKGKGTKVVRSASLVPSSDESGDESVAKKDTIVSKKISVDTDGDVDIVDEDAHPTSVASTSKASSTVVERSAAPAKTNEDKSDSELSVLIDDAPKRGRKKKGSGESTSTKTAKGRGRKPKESVEESPQDQEIKRLKSFVVACGVRKMWSKEFKDIADDKSAQIRKLKTILSDLGMTGRLSMEKAKSIREKRELAQELEEVQKFEKTFVSGPTRAKRETVQESEEEESEAEVVPPKKKMNARMSIMAFLGDQSD